jgi:GDPmannose 4,6-dehydratase
VWQGTGLEEKGIHSKTGDIIIEIDAQYFRPTEVDLLLGDPNKAVDTFGFDPNETSLETLVQIMMDHDLEYVKHEKEMKQRV